MRLPGVVLFGNSITQGATSSGWFTTANLQAGSPTLLLSNAGIGGNTTAAMLARIETDVVAHNPDITIVEGGGNDVTQGRSAAAIIGDLTAIYDRLAEIGSKIIATTILPSIYMDQASEQTALTTANTWIRDHYSDWPNARLADWNPPMTDGVSEWAPHDGYTSDGVHPNSTGGAVMAGVLRPVLLAAAS